MGLLDNSTNGIIIDAVLTDFGRRALSRNDGSFSIVKFALADDEVDYSLITQYGAAVGKEKIEKNTPVFEAGTHSMNGLKSLLVSSAVITDNIGYLVNTTSGNVVLDVVSQTQKSITISQETNSGFVIPADLTNQSYIVKVDNRFLSIVGRSPRNVSNRQQAQYFINRDQIINSFNGSSLSFTLGVKSNITSATFNTYGTTSSSGIIRTFVTITGKESGQSLTIEVQINRTAT